MAGPSRNGPCPCGSGLKYKRCHEGADGEKPPSSGMLPVVLLALLIGAGAVAVVIGVSRDGLGRSTRVWSPEHGHWHEAGAPARRAGGVPINPRSGTPSAPQSAVPDAPRPAPPGTPPPGKVWSPEHGHWHDVAPSR